MVDIREDLLRTLVSCRVAETQASYFPREKIRRKGAKEELVLLSGTFFRNGALLAFPFVAGVVYDFIVHGIPLPIGCVNEKTFSDIPT